MVLTFGQKLWAQTQTVTGTITDAENRMPLPGVTVLEKNSSNGTTTDFDGNYSINVEDGAILVFSYVGFSTVELSVGSQNTIDVEMNASSESLDEVIVTALGIGRERKSLGYAVTQLNSESVSEVKTTNAINSLQGKVAGVNITPASTGAGGTSRVIIRGASSLTGNNNPLYVVDGVTIDNSQLGEAGPYGGSDFGDGISSINPDDIASVSVLKGGAAAALYGSRASNGVIIITTKGGKNQQGLGVEYATQLTFDEVNTGVFDFQNQYGQGSLGLAPVSVNDALDNPFSSWGPRLGSIASSIQFDGVERPYVDTGDNLDKFYRTGTTLIHTLAVTKGGGDLNYRFSATDLNNEDVVPNSELNRKSFSLNVNSIAAEKLTVDISARYIVEKVNNRPRVSDAPGNANYSAALFPANVDIRTASPGIAEDGTEQLISSNTFTQNPYWAANRFNTFDRKNRILSSATLNYKFFDWLDLTARAGIDHSAIRTTIIEPYGTAYIPLGSITEREVNITQVDADVILGINKKINEKFAVDAFFGANKNTQRNDNLTLIGSRFVIPFLEILSNVENSSQSRTLNELAISSLYGSVELSYDDLLFLSVTGRNDWFSTLSGLDQSSENSEFYPSVSGSFVFSQLLEDQSSWISLGRLRAGYSEVAGGAQTPYQLTLPYQIFGQGHLGNPLGQVATSSVPNPNLTPFSKEEVEIGLDLSLFSNRLGIDLAYYKNSTKRDIVPVDISNTSGYSNTLLNLGQLDNKGIEMLVTGTPIRNENFRWNLSYNLSYNESEVVATDESGNNISIGDVRTFDANSSQVVGQPFGVIFGTAYLRNPAGDIVYDASGFPLVDPERKVLGEGVSPWTMGLNNTFSYKGFNLSFLIDAKFGGQVYSGTNRVAYGAGLHKETLNGRENGLTVTGVTNVTEENPNGEPFTYTHDDTTLQTYYGSNSGVGRIAEEFIGDSDFIKFRQLSLGYTVPASVLERTFISSIDLSIVGRNLFFIHKDADNIDPEGGFNAGNAQGLEYFGLPPVRSYGLSFNVKF